MENPLTQKEADDKCLFRVPLSASKDEIKYLIRCILYRHYRIKENKTPEETDWTLRSNAFLCATITLFILLSICFIIPRMESTIPPYFLVIVNIIAFVSLTINALSFIMNWKYFDIAYWSYHFKNKKANSHLAASGHTEKILEFYDDHAKIAGLPSILSYTESFYFFKESTLYLVFNKDGKGCCAIIHGIDDNHPLRAFINVRSKMEMPDI
ncbi:MAG: hypothetical protein Q4C55_09010 [Eubacterium sp.]|nr:hypothetical protein [Eubacterium sp.]